MIQPAGTRVLGQTVNQQQATTLANQLDAAYEYDLALCNTVTKGSYNFDKHDGDWMDWQQLFYLSDPDIFLLTDDQNLQRRVGKSNQKDRVVDLREFLKQQGLSTPLAGDIQIPRVVSYEERSHDRACQRLQQIPRVGPLVATAMVAAVGNGSAFVKGRDFTAWLGLVPRQHSTGGKAKLLGISKRGNRYLRRLFIHGARAVLTQARPDQLAFRS